MQQAQDIADDARVQADLAIFHKSAIDLTDEGLSKNGKDAIGSADAANAKIIESAKAFSQNLANDRQRNRFLPRVREILSSSAVTLSRNERKQTEDFNDQSAIARIAAASEAAAKYRTQPEVIASSIAQAEDAVATRAKAKGWSDEVVAEEMAAARSGVYASALQAMVSNNEHAMFLDAYQKVEGQLTAKDHAVFAKVNAATSDLVTEQATVQTIVDKHPNDFAAAIGEARATLSGKMEEDVIGAINVRFKEKAEARTEYQRVVTDDVWRAFEAGGERVSAIPRDKFVQFEAFNGEGVARMKQIEEANANQPSGPKRSDLEVYGDWIYQTKEWKIDPKNDPRLLKGKVSDSDLRYMMKEVEDFKNEERGLLMSGASPRGPATDRQTVQGMISTSILENASLFTPVDLSEEAKDDADAKRGAFARYVRDQVDAFQVANKGRNPDRIEAQKIIDEGLIEGVRPVKWWYDKEVRRFEAKPGDVFPESTAPQIPPDDRARISQKLAAGGFAVNERNILIQYKHEHPEAP
jgi:hypothetical protein